MAVQTQSTNISAFLKAFLTKLDSRQRDILVARYGLGGGNPETLQTIGDKYGITRERVRQIESAAIRLLIKEKDHTFIARLSKAANARLREVGGVEEERSFFDYLHGAIGEKADAKVFKNVSAFLLELAGSAHPDRDAYGNWHPFWYAQEADKKRAQQFIVKLTGVMKNRKGDVLSGSFDEVVGSLAKEHGVSSPIAKNFFAISQKFAEGPFGAFGLVDWAEVNPKTARDWAYLILKRENAPLHFTEIAKRIAEYRKTKKTNTQTIHNELIKDNRFVLVGRGIYTLDEFGAIPGTAREIIAHILKKHGPLHSQEVVAKVKEQRILKDGTILINLQNKKHFSTLSDGRYSVREA
ncbi:MAG: sigma factor-like helix-turn-helix DNA-binding protein [Patescibacteria group bacterium]